MSLKKFTEEKQDTYIGKWCLYKTYYWEKYQRLYVIDIKDGLIKYNDDLGRVVFADISEFEDLYFRIDPFSQDA